MGRDCFWSGCTTPCRFAFYGLIRILLLRLAKKYDMENVHSSPIQFKEADVALKLIARIRQVEVVKSLPNQIKPHS